MFSEADVKDKGCTFPEALKTIEEKCHGQEACSMVTAPEIFGSGLPSYNGGDPCPGVSYFKVEFFFKFYGKLSYLGYFSILFKNINKSDFDTKNSIALWNIFTHFIIEKNNREQLFLEHFNIENNYI